MYSVNGESVPICFSDDSENTLLPNNVMMIRNYGEDKEGLKERRGGAKEQQMRPSQVGVPIQVELESNLDSRNSCHQNRRPDRIPTPFWTFFIWMESIEDQLFNATGHTSKLLLSPWETSKQ
jgi:hypothetical protein